VTDSPRQVLDNLSESVEQRDLDEKVGTLAKLALGGAIAAKILGPKSKSGTGVLAKQKIGVLDLARALVKARDQQQEVAAVIGLLGISTRVLLRIPALRDLGYRVQKVLEDDRLKEFVE